MRERKLKPAGYLCKMKVLMVCLGNICRSPLAEGILQYRAQQAGLKWTVDSAGTNGYHIDNPPHNFSQKVALKNGIDISNQRARKFIEADFERYDKIYAMANDVLSDIKNIAKEKFDCQKADLLLNELYPNQNKDVPDPWYSSSFAAYEEVFFLIDKACEKIIVKHQS